MFKNKKSNNSKDVLEKYIYTLESDKSNLEAEIKNYNRQMNREISNYLDPIRNIANMINSEYDSDQKIKYIKTQINNFLSEKNLDLFIPKVNDIHDKNTMIVEDTVSTSNKEQNDRIECVLSIGIKKDDKIILPAKVRVYKGEQNEK